MKTTTNLLLGLVVIILCACVSDIDFEDNEEKRIKKVPLLKVEILNQNSSITTRSNYAGFPETIFETGDSIGLYVFDGSGYIKNNVRFIKQSDGSWLPDKKVPYGEDYVYYAYFPYRATTYSPSIEGTVDDVNTKFSSFISDVSNFFWQADQSTKDGFTYSNLMISKGVVTDIEENIVTVKFVMQHKRGLAVLKGNAYESSFSGNKPFRIDDKMVFLMKPSVITNFTDEKETYSLSAKMGEYVVHHVSSPYIDLSKTDNAGNARASMTTANCYLVHGAGKYMLPLIYGNAIKNGEVNTVAFKPGDFPFVKVFCPNFVNHNDTGITGPWITKSGSGINAGMGLTAASAELLWQDVQSLITSVGVDGDYLKFTIGTFKPGNAVIAVKDDSGTILWSWHIWATNETLATTTAVNTGSHVYNIAPVNLGWVPTGGNGKRGNCPYYQWGRKDPFVSSSVNRAYNINNNYITVLTTSSFGYSTTVSIGDNIKNPTIFYYSNNNSSPTSTEYWNTWDAQFKDVAGNMATATKKTIYDPCPPGFCVPTGNLWYYFGDGSIRSDSNWDSTNKGKTWTLNGANIYFPAAGYRYSGEVSLVGTGGRYWSASCKSYYNGFRIFFSSSNWSCDDTDRRYYANTIRPVLEE